MKGEKYKDILRPKNQKVDLKNLEIVQSFYEKKGVNLQLIATKAFSTVPYTEKCT